MKLRRELEQFLEGWRDYLSAEWNADLDGLEPDCSAVKENLTFNEAEPIFPGRKNKSIKMAPPGAHIFRALDGVRRVTCESSFSGRHPYPNISQATGRSLEQGDLPPTGRQIKR